MSGRKSNLKQFQSVVDEDMSQSTITSAVTNIGILDNIGIQLNFTGSPIGNFYIQISADYNQDNEGNILNIGNWITLPLSPAPAAAGSANQIYIDMTELSAPWIRVVYTKTSGSGVLNAYITGKMI